MRKILTLFMTCMVFSCSDNKPQEYIIIRDDTQEDSRKIEQYDSIEKAVIKEQLQDSVTNELNNTLDVYADMLESSTEMNEIEKEKNEIEKAKNEIEKAKNEIEKAKNEIEKAKNEIEKAKNEIEKAKNEIEKAKNDSLNQIIIRQNTHFILVGSTRNLKNRNVLIRRKKLNTNFNKNLFSVLENSKRGICAKNKIIKIHPYRNENTYRLSRDKKCIEIINPETFWEISRYLVVETRNR